MDIESINPRLQNKWDYLGWKKHTTYELPIEQKDWSQTLITKINELSAHIHMAGCTKENPNGLGPADTIMMNNRCFDIIKKLEYFKPEEMRLGTRFNVVVNNMIGANAVFVFIEDVPDDYKNKDRTVGVVKIENYG
jgi:hypothetical protein